MNIRNFIVPHGRPRFVSADGNLWILLVSKYVSDGECNILTGPSDIGMTIALFVATAINYWKIKTIELK